MSNTNWISKNNIHFKVYGAGPPIVLFHPSPNSSDMMHDLAVKLASDFTVICPDTPGYGSSPKLEVANPAMIDFVHAFKEMFDSLGLDSITIYGSATGSQIGIRYGIEYPDHVSHLILDNCAHFTDEEREAILESYFPDLTPQLDGSHLVQVWDMVTSLFQYFPWCFKDQEHKLNGPMPPPAILHMIAKDYLRAGADYDIAYKAAFEHEKVDYVQQLTVPTTILRWEGSILKSYTDRLFDYDLPMNVIGQKISADRSLRFKEIAEHITEVATSSLSYTKESITDSLDKHEIEGANDFLDASPPKPDTNGFHLINAWHQLRDKYLFDNNIESEDPKNLNEQLVRWYSGNDKSI